jgi:hypothetical protein
MVEVLVASAGRVVGDAEIDVTAVETGPNRPAPNWKLDDVAEVRPLDENVSV